MKPYLKPLMGVRFVAALSVVLTHLHVIRFSTAVPFFFVLSGFILTYKYAEPDPNKRTRFWGLKSNVWDYILSRFTRLYPVYFLSLLLLCAARLYTGYDFMNTLGGMLASFSLLQAWFPHVSVGWNTPGWSCSVEVFFYLLFPWMVSWTSGWTPRELQRSIVLSWLVGMLPVLLYYSEWGSWDFPVRRMQILMYNPAVHIPDFLIGVALGQLWLQRERIPASDPLRTATLNGSSDSQPPRTGEDAEASDPGTSDPGALVQERGSNQDPVASPQDVNELLRYRATQQPQIPANERSDDSLPTTPTLSRAESGDMWVLLAGLIATGVTLWPAVPTLVIHGVCLAPIFAMLVWGLACGGSLASLLSYRWIVRLGHASYAFYVLQDPLQHLVFGVAGCSPEQATNSLVGIYLASLLVLSLAVNLVFEEPLMEWARHKFAQDPFPLGRREVVVALSGLATCCLSIFLLPQKIRPFQPVLVEKLRRLGAEAVGADRAVSDSLLVAYRELLPDTRVVENGDQKFPFVLASSAWKGSSEPGLIFLGKEPAVDIILWARRDAKMVVPVAPVQMGQVLGLTPVEFCQEAGLHGLEGAGTATPYRWTTEKAQLRLPVAAGARHLSISLAGSHGQPVIVKLNGQESLRQVISDQPTLVLNLPTELGPFLDVEILCATFVPHQLDAKSGDTRALGVPFLGVKFLP